LEFFGKSFYGVDVKNNFFMIDVIMTLKWTDKRVARLLPDGMDSMTLSDKESQIKIWLPGVEITNRDIRKNELISTSVLITREGEVTKVERANVVCKQKYDLTGFPFDEQTLMTKIASTKYMLSEVVLEADTSDGVSGLREGLFKGEIYQPRDPAFETSTFEDVDGALKKSRGVLNIRVARLPDKYWQQHLVPSFLVIAISWGVFYFPYIGPFITPRLALSILALLSFTNLDLKMSAQLPDGAPYNWNDLFNSSVQMCMFSTIILNIFTEVCFHQLKVEDLAKAVNHECKIILPFASVCTLSLILGNAGEHGALSLETANIISKIILFGVIGSYMAYTAHRCNVGIAAQRRKEVAAAAAAKALP